MAASGGHWSKGKFEKPAKKQRMAINDAGVLAMLTNDSPPPEPDTGIGSAISMQEWDTPKTTREIEIQARRKFPGTSFEFSGLNVENTREVMKKYEILSREYPEVGGFVKYVGTKYPGGRWGNAVAVAYRGGPTKMNGRIVNLPPSISLNPKYFSYAGLIEENNSATNSFTVSGNDPGITLVHEFGHILEYYHAEQGNKSPEKAILLKDWKLEAHEMYKRKAAGAKKRAGKYTFSAGRRDDWFISDYAYTDRHETFAEGFAKLMTGDKRSIYVQQQEKLLGLLNDKNLTPEKVQAFKDGWLEATRPKERA